MITPPVSDRITLLTGDELPAYIYDVHALREHVDHIRAALPERAELYYAVKANPDPALLTAVEPAVSGYEVSSGGELAHVAEVVPGARLAFGGPGKTATEIERALRAGVSRIHVESVHELRLLAALAARTSPDRVVDVLLRINLPLASHCLDGAALAMGGRPTPFGLDPDDADTCLALLSTPECRRLRFRGIHSHLASGLDARAQLLLVEQIVEWSTRLAARHRIRLDEINTGGGMAVDYVDPTLRFDWTAFGTGLAELLGRYPGPRLRIEPGRALTAYCGWYATEVLDVKVSLGEVFAVLRGGTHHLRTPVTKGHSQPFTVLPVDHWPHPWPRPQAERQPITLVGQLCTPKDVLARAVPVGSLRAGDRVAFALTGAYAWNISHHSFLMHPKPAFHYVM